MTEPADPTSEPAPDAVEARILEESAAIAAGEAPERLPAPIAAIAVLGDLDGALGIGAARAHPGARLRCFADPLDGELAADAALAAAGLDALRLGLEPALLEGAELILLRLPKSNEELRAIVELAAAHAAPGAVLVAGGREKHLNRTQNELLGEGFAAVRGSLGRRKARALVASGPRRDDRAAPGLPIRAARLAEAELAALAGPEPVEVRAVASAFAGARLDLGTRALLAALAEAAPELDRELGPAPTILDLGCGTGLLAVAAARRWPEAEVIAVDRSWAAVESARATAAANGLDRRIRVVRDLAASSLPGGSVDLVLCNPPFHDGHEVDEDLAGPIFAGAARALRPGGLLVAVYNAHLPHRSALARLVGATRQLARDPKFVVTLSTRR